MSSALRAPREKRVVLVLQHAASENLGTIEEALTGADLAYRYVRVFHGQPVPTDLDGSSGLIVMGGPMGVYETDRFPFLREEIRLMESFLKAQKPILGVCLGSQLLARALGADVKKGRQKEIGWYQVELGAASRQDPLWRGQPARFVAFHWHGDLFDLPHDAALLASSDITPVQSYRFGTKTYGILFHLEVTEGHIGKMLDEFADEGREENLSAEEIRAKSQVHLPPLQQIGATVFRRWTELV
jgi:GMP synthase (glutamine-hydrolysing)